MKAEGRRQKVEGRKGKAQRAFSIGLSRVIFQLPSCSNIRGLLAVFRFLPSTFYLLPSAFCLLPSAFYLLPSAAFAQTPSAKPTPPPAHAAPPGLSFENYRMVRTRNVFDPDRRAMNPTQPAASTAPIKESDYIALTGTMINAGKTLAFFSGSRSDFNKVLTMRDKIADATITNITAAGVEVDRGGRKLTVSVGQTVPLDNSQPADASALRASTAANATAASVTSNSPAAASASAAAANSLNSKQQEIMKRMMEKRKQDGLQ